MTPLVESLVAENRGAFTTTSARRAGRAQRGSIPRRSRARGGLALRRERERREIAQADVADGLAALYDDGYPFPPTLLSFLETEHCRLPRGFRADYLAVLDTITTTGVQ